MAEFEKFIDKIAKSTLFRGANMIDFTDTGQEMYISFQTLLRFLDEYVNLVTNYDSSSESGTPIIKINWEDPQPFIAYNSSVSFNLLTCYLYNQDFKTTAGQFYEDGIATFHPFTHFPTESESDNVKKIRSVQEDLKAEAKPIVNYSAYPSIGNISYIYLNCGMIAKKVIEGSNNPDNITGLRQFLQDICDDVGKSLGSINDFQVVVDEDTNTLSILDFNQKKIPGLGKVDGFNTTVINAQGLGSFVTEISAESSITPELATTIAIAAQVQPNQVGYDATSFSALSRGITDRIYSNIKVRNTAEMPFGEELFTKKIEQYEEAKEAYLTVIRNQIESEFDGQIVYKNTDNLSLESTCVDFFKALQGGFTQTRQLLPCFIPVKLELTILGISGMKIFQRFRLSSDILPLSYRDQFDFIITGLSHEVNSNNKWTTKISALTVIREI